MEITDVVKILASAFVLLIAAYFVQEQADRYDTRAARRIQRATAAIIVTLVLVIAISTITIIYINN